MKLFLAFKFVFKLQKLVKINMIKWKGLEKKIWFQNIYFSFFQIFIILIFKNYEMGEEIY